MKKEKKKEEKKDLKKEIKEEKSTEKKSKKKIFIIIGIILLLIILFLLWWFNRKFDVTFKYNNGDADYTVQVKYLKVIKDEDVKKDLVNKGSSFVGYFETYYLSGEEIEKVNKQTDTSNICKEGFELTKEKNKCISKTEFDFENTKIKDDKIIEAVWSSISFNINPKSKSIYVGDSFKITATVSGTNNKTVKWSSNNSSIAKVDGSGKVTGVKKGTTTIVAESNGIKRTCTVTVKEVKKVEKDTGKIALNASKKCVIGNDSVKVTASITGNALDKTIKWTYPSCFSVQNTSSTVKTLTRNSSCSSSQELKPTITAKLNNGSSAKTSFTYEPQLTFKVYNNGRIVTPSSNGGYYGSYITIETNMNASFSGNYIRSTTSNSVSLGSAASTTITIKTACGQTKNVEIHAIIN